MEPSSSTSDPSTPTFRKYLSQQSSASPSIPPYQELVALRQELLTLSENASQRYEKYASELARLDSSATLPQSKDSSLSSTPTSASANAFNSSSQGFNHSSSTGANASLAGRTSASPNTSSPSSFPSNSRAGGSSSTTTQGAAAGASPAVVKLGVVTLKLKRSDAAGMWWFVCDISHLLRLIQYH